MMNIIKKAGALLSAAALLGAAVPAQAYADDLYTAEINGAVITYDLAQTDAAIIKSVTNAVGELIIPDEIDGHKVTEVSESAFAGNQELTYVQLPEACIAVGTRAFAGCTSLTQVSLSDKTEYLGEGAFIGCTSLSQASIGSVLTSVPDSCFSSCTSLYEVFIPESVTDIGAYAFFNCPDFDTIIPPTVLTMGSCALGMTADPVSGYSVRIDGFLICGTKGSTAEKYAYANGNDFLDLSAYLPGDVNDDGIIDSGDASSVLQEYAKIATKKSSGFTKKKNIMADTNNDRIIDSSDASDILKTYVQNATAPRE